MPETTLEPAASANSDTTVGDAAFTSGTVAGIEWDDSFHQFGRDAEKTAANHGAIQHYDTSGIPLGAHVSGAKVEIKASAADSGAFTAKLDVLARTTRVDQVTEQVHNAQVIYYPDSGIFPVHALWDDARTTGANKNIVMPLNTEHGIGGVAQAWKCDTAPAAGTTFAYHYFYLTRSGSMSATTVRAKIYEASGTAGNWVKGNLIDNGYPRDADDVNTSGGAFRLGTAAGVDPSTGLHVHANGWTPTVGQTYISELIFEGGTGSSSISVGMLTTADGSEDNAVIVARYNVTPPRVLQGFGGYTQYLAGARIKDATRQGSGSTFTPPTFSSGTVYSFGSLEYNGDANFTEASNFKADLQAALSARTSTDDWTGVRLQDFAGTTDGRMRRFHSSKAGTATSGSLKGTLLTLTWSLPATVTVRSRPSSIFNETIIEEPGPSLRAPSETSIANAALVILGERRINDLNENAKSANVIQTRFDDVRDALLRAMTWRFATRRAQIAASGTSPAWGFTYTYPLPFDCLRVLEVDDRWGFGWRVESNAIVTNVESPLAITYVARVEDPIEMDSEFRQLFAAALAVELAETITGDSRKLETAARRFGALLESARATNGQEESPRDPALTAWQLWRGEKER
jgi:hypothetical protein